MREPRPGFTLIELLVVIAILAVLFGLTASAVQAAREAARRITCANNLRQLGLAAHAYHDSQGSLPPGCSYHNGADPQPHMSWLTRLLPFLEQDALWGQAVRAYGEDRFFEAPPHWTVAGSVVRTFACPSDTRVFRPWPINGLRGPFMVGLTSYIGVSGTERGKNDGVFYLDSQTRITDITDGTSYTLMAGERPPSSDQMLGWWYAGWGQAKDGSAEMLLGVNDRNVSRPSCAPGPYDFRPGNLRNLCDVFHFWSPHRGGTHFLFAGGSVRFLRYSAANVLASLATRNGGEVAIDPE